MKSNRLPNQRPTCCLLKPILRRVIESSGCSLAVCSSVVFNRASNQSGPLASCIGWQRLHGRQPTAIQSRTVASCSTFSGRGGGAGQSLRQKIRVDVTAVNILASARFTKLKVEDHSPSVSGCRAASSRSIMNRPLGFPSTSFNWSTTVLVDASSSTCSFTNHSRKTSVA